MFKTNRAVVTDDKKFVFVASTHGNPPVAFISAKWMLAVMRQMELGGILDTYYHEALVELASYLRENDL